MPIVTNKIISYLLGLSRSKKNILIIFSDYILLVFAFWASLSLRINDFFIPTTASLYLILIAPLITIPIFHTFGLYKSLIRYSNYRSAMTIAIAISIYSLLWFLAVFYIEIIEKPYNFLFINWLVTIFFVGGSRYIARFLLLYRTIETKNVLIYGAGSAGTQIYYALNHEPEITVVGFIDDNNELWNKFIDGVKIYNSDSLSSIVSNKKIDEIFIAIPSASKFEIAKIIESLKQYELKLRKLPAIGDLASGKIDISDLKKIKIEDLLRREQRQPDNELLARDITGKNVLITGAGGSIGSELSRQILKLDPESLILFDISEYALYKIEQELSSFSNFSKVSAIIGNVTEQDRLERILEKNEINTIYHAAAYKHVPMVERNAIAAIRCNIFGTLSCIQASINQSVSSFVFISTDKAVRPTNIMGATKRFAEQILQSISEKYQDDQIKDMRISMVRFGNVLGSSGSVVPLFKKQIEDGGPLTVTDPKIIRYFMTLQEASQLVIQAGAMGECGDIFLLDMGEPIKVLDLARDMIQLSGKSVLDQNNPEGEIEIQFTGLRPGEKLYEELLISSESEPTEHEKIFIAKDSYLSWNIIENYLKELEEASSIGDDEHIKKIFLNSVDGFNPES